MSINFKTVYMTYKMVPNHQYLVRKCAATAIQAGARGYLVRQWFNDSWGDEEDCITTADLLRLTAGSRRYHPQATVDDGRGNPFRALISSSISNSGYAEPWAPSGVLVNPECGAPRRVTECPCCSSPDIIVRGFSGGGVGVDENVYCGSCGEFLGIEMC